MTQIGDFFARIISTGGSRGLSGDTELVLPSDPPLSYFNERLRRHVTSDDLVGEPERLWDSSGFLARRGGLRGHLLAERGTGVLGISDVLVIVNRDDWRRSFREVRRPWVDRARALLHDRYQRFAEEEDFHSLFPQREIGFTIVEDGCEALGGHALNLQRGEFVTGLLPNHYSGPVGSSRAIVAVHMHIPGQWEGYREVGRLWSDQVLFTVGNHWLDSFSHPGLAQPSLYRLHRYGDGSFVHVINPEVREQYRVASQETPGGASVLSIEAMDGSPVAYLVLAVMEGEAFISEQPSRPPMMATLSIPDPLELSAERTADRPTTEAPPLSMGSRTVVPLELDERILTLREVGALLQKVHFGRFMEGYDVYVGRGGEVATAMARPAATLHVRGRKVSVQAHQPGVGLGGIELPIEAPAFIEGDTTLTVGSVALDFRDLSHQNEDGWPYLAEIRRQGATAHMVFGSRYLVGRDPRCKVRLPDEPHNDNIVWRSELREGGTIRSRNGEIPKSRFYIDSIMVASEHAEIDLSDQPRIFSRARHCYTYVRREGQLFALFPSGEGGGPTEQALEAGDELLVGNCVFAVSYAEPEARDPNRVRSVPDPQPAPLSAELLAAALDPAPKVRKLPPVEPGLDPADEFDLPAAAGLGESGRPPPPVIIDGTATDSFTLENAPRAANLAQDPAPTPRIAPPMLAASLSEYEAGGFDFDDYEAEGTQPAPPPDPTDLPTVAGPPSMHFGLDASIADAFDIPRPGPNLASSPGVPRAPIVPPPPMQEDPTGLPMGAPPPVAIQPSGDSILGDDPVPGAAAIRSAPDRASANVGGVAVVDEADWQLELTRPGRLSLLGWMVTGTLTLGNHGGADLILPESRSDRDQVFRPMDYLEVFARGGRARLERLAPSEVRLFQGGQPVEAISDPDAARVEILRRGPDGFEDFAIRLTLERSDQLPDPRARLLKIDLSDRMVRALFTLGLPLRQPRSVELGGVACRLTCDGDALELSGYLPAYRRADGSFRPFFLGSPARGFQTLPEDGTPVLLRPGDRLIAGSAVYIFEVAAGHHG